MTDSPTSAPSNTRSYNFVEDFYCDDGRWVSKILMTAVQSEVFTKLSGKAATLTQIQTILEMEPSRTKVLCTSLVVLGLLQVSLGKDNEQNILLYYNSEISNEFLDKRKPSSYTGELITMLDNKIEAEFYTEDNSIQPVNKDLTLKGSDVRNISVGILFQKIHLDTYLQYLGLICPYTEYARYDLDIGRGGYYLFLKHDLGRKWSSFLKQWISQGIKTTTGISPEIDISDDQLVATFKERR
jgi:hypothetical protein